MTDIEIELLTKLIAEVVDFTLKSDENGTQVFNLVVFALNKVLKAAQQNGVASKFQVMELCMRAWLVWYDYQKTHNPKLLTDLASCAQAISALV